MSTLLFAMLGGIVLIGIVFAAAITLSSPKSPKAMEAITAPFRTMDVVALPPVSSYEARDGAKLAFRAYPSVDAKHAAVLIHGSSASGISMHTLAEYLQQKHIDVYVPDMRGHGESGRKGDIDYIGQLEDDLEDFTRQLLKTDKTLTLIGFSSGGGFALRFAASERQEIFDRYVALAPFIRYDAPTTRPNNGEWAHASVPRIVAISLMRTAGHKYLGHLPVIAFAIHPDMADYATSAYSYRLWRNFALHDDYRADLKKIRQPLTVMVGDQDELFYPQQYLTLFADVQPHAEISIVPGTGHVTLTMEPSAMAAIADNLH
ncbi:MAG: alpha/beta hydrolase [Smithellaceae bacterium]